MGGEEGESRHVILTCLAVFLLALYCHVSLSHSHFHAYEEV